MTVPLHCVSRRTEQVRRLAVRRLAVRRLAVRLSQAEHEERRRIALVLHDDLRQ